MIQLFIVRHGPAVSLRSSGLSRDADRVLSEKGKVRTREAARGFGLLEHPVSRIVTSPLVRARQTAEIFSEELGYNGEITVRDDLTPEADPASLLGWLRRRANRPTMLVGHMPNVAILTSLLVCGSDAVDIHFRKASVCCLTVDEQLLPGTAVLDAFLPASYLRLIR